LIRLAIARTPLRIGLAGGGSDLAGGPGAVVNSSIDKYVYCVAKRRSDHRVYLSWRDKEIVENASELRHDLIREALMELGLYHGVEITTFADVPGRGSGLGSSAATCVSALHALKALRGRRNEEVSSYWLAETASVIEIDRLGRCVGRQDQYAAAFGGFQYLEFDDGRVWQQSTIEIGDARRAEISDMFMLFSPPEGEPARNASNVLKGAVGLSNDGEFRKGCMAEARGCRDAVLTNCGVETFSCILRKHHELKIGCFPDYLPSALKDIDLPFKLCGAGRSGHVLICCALRDRAVIVDSLRRKWGWPMEFRFTPVGSEIIYREER